MNHVRLFKPQFATLVEYGEKLQTVRPIPKRMPKRGENISLRMWTGKPYRSKQRVLCESVISDVIPVEITAEDITLGDVILGVTAEWLFARADGFKTPVEMRFWFRHEHGFPFNGIVIQWLATASMLKPLPLAPST